MKNLHDILDKIPDGTYGSLRIYKNYTQDVADYCIEVVDSGGNAVCVYSGEARIITQGRAQRIEHSGKCIHNGPWMQDVEKLVEVVRLKKLRDEADKRAFTQAILAEYKGIE